MDVDRCPITGEFDCMMCSGEYCERHGYRPCDCDVVDRHRPKEMDIAEEKLMNGIASVRIQDTGEGWQIIVNGIEHGKVLPIKMSNDARQRLCEAIESICDAIHLDGRLAVRNKVATFMSNGNL